MDHGRRWAAQTRAGVRVGGPAEEAVGAAGTGAAQPGQVVSRRTLAALADWTVLARRRCAAVAKCRPACRSVGVRSRRSATRRRATGARRDGGWARAARFAGAAC